MKPRIGIYKTVFPLYSETFISEQARALRHFKPVFLIRNRTGKIDFEYLCCHEIHGGNLRAPLFSLTHHPLFFGHSDKIGKLNLIHAHFGFDGVYAMPLARKAKIPLIVTFHGVDATATKKALFRSEKLFQIYFGLYEKKLITYAAKFIAVSKFIENKLIQKGYPASKIVQHYIGIDIDKIRPIKKQPTHNKRDDRYILCVGRHTEKKGIDTLLRAFARVYHKYGSVKLILAGDGPITEKLLRLSEKLGIKKRVIFMGAQSHAQVIKLMQRAEVFALPSQTARSGDSEGLGMVFNEASACGIPVVATRHGGIPEAVIDGETGFLTPEKDDCALADRLELLLSDPGLACNMGMRGREYVCEQFNLKLQTRKLEEIYRRIGVTPRLG